MQVQTRLSSSASAPAAWQSVGAIVGSVLANVTVEETVDFSRSRQLALPLQMPANGKER